MKRFSVFAIAFMALLLWTAPSFAVEFGGQYRLRGEFRDNVWFTEMNNDKPLPGPDDDGSYPSDTYRDECVEYALGCQHTDVGQAFWGQRVRLWAIANPTDDTTVKITIQDTRKYWGYSQPSAGTYDQGTPGGPNLTDDGSNVLDLHESYVLIKDFFGQPVSLKVGRQELVYGDQRLVGNADWSNNARSFDAIKLSYASDMFDADFWTAKIKEANLGTTTASGTKDSDQDFYGLYATLKTIPNNTLDAYVLYLRDGSPTQITWNNNGAIGGINEVQELWTYGLRLKGAFAGVDYTAEVPFQSGQINTAGTDYNIDAWAYAIKAGYTIPGGPYGLRVGAEYDFASGDNNSMDKDIETFSNLFPTNHAFLGTMDLQGWRNVKAWNLNVSGKPMDKLTAKLDYWSLKLAEKNDGWYSDGQWNNVPTDYIRTGSCFNLTSGPVSCDEDNIGSELDLTLNYAYNKAVGISAGISRFFTGDLIDKANKGWGLSSDDQTWGYLQLTANF